MEPHLIATDVTCHMGSRSVTFHPVLPSYLTHPALTPARQAGTRFIYPGRLEGLVDLSDLLHTEMVYPPADGHASNYLLNPRTAP